MGWLGTDAGNPDQGLELILEVVTMRLEIGIHAIHGHDGSPFPLPEFRVGDWLSAKIAGSRPDDAPDPSENVFAVRKSTPLSISMAGRGATVEPPQTGRDQPRFSIRFTATYPVPDPADGSEGGFLNRPGKSVGFSIEGLVLTLGNAYKMDGSDDCTVDFSRRESIFFKT